MYVFDIHDTSGDGSAAPALQRGCKYVLGEVPLPTYQGRAQPRAARRPHDCQSRLCSTDISYQPPQGALQHAAIRCNILQHTATHCNNCQSELCGTDISHQPPQGVLHHAATHCNTLQHTATTAKWTLWYRHFCALQHTENIATHCNTLQHEHAATHCGDSRGIFTMQHCNTLQHTATHCNTLQHTATHCNRYTRPSPQSTAPFPCASLSGSEASDFSWRSEHLCWAFYPCGLCCRQ